MIGRTNESKWFEIVRACVFVGLFIWLRWFSGFWLHRWTGLCFGIALVLSALPTAARMQRQVEFQERYDIPRRVSVLGAITSLALGTIVMKSFFFGPSFFSGSRGRGHDGFIGVVVLAAAVDGAYLFWRRTRSASNTNINNPRTTLNHG
jgi:hypothetical protein